MDKFLSNQEAEGRIDSSGNFTIDLNRARAKLGRFSLQNQSDYLLKFVQSAVQLKAYRFRLIIKPNKVELVFGFPRAHAPEFRAILNQLVTPEESDEASRNLAYALASVMNQPDTEAEFSLLTNERAEVLRFDSESAHHSVKEGASCAPDSCRAVFKLKRGSGFWPSRANKKLVEQEESTMRRARLAPLDLTVNNHPLEAWPAPSEPFLIERHLNLTDRNMVSPSEHFHHYRISQAQVYLRKHRRFSRQATRTYLIGEETWEQGSAVLQMPLQRSGSLKSVIHGVLSLPVELPHQLLVTGHFPQLKTDLSGLSLVQDEYYENIVTALGLQQQEMRSQFLLHFNQVESLRPKGRRQAFREDVRSRFSPDQGDKYFLKTLDDWMLIERLKSRERLYRVVNTQDSELGLFWVLPKDRASAMQERWNSSEWGASSPEFSHGYLIEEKSFLVSKARNSLLYELENGLANPWQLVFQLGQLLAQGHAHDRVHADLRPDTILLDQQGQAFLRPPARVHDINNAVTMSPEKFEWISYLAPEQIVDREMGPETDQYQLAATTYHLLSGEQLFVEPSPIMALTKVLFEEPEQRAEIEDSVWTVLNRALSKEPRNRFSSVNEMLQALQSAVAVESNPLASDDPSE